MVPEPWHCTVIYLGWVTVGRAIFKTHFKRTAIWSWCRIRRWWNSIRSLWGKNMSKKSRKYMFDGTNFWRSGKWIQNFQLINFLTNKRPVRESDSELHVCFRLKMTNFDIFIISICEKPVNCTSNMFVGDMSELGKRRSGLEEFPLIAQLSTSFQVTVT